MNRRKKRLQKRKEREDIKRKIRDNKQFASEGYGDVFGELADYYKKRLRKL